MSVGVMFLIAAGLVVLEFPVAFALMAAAMSYLLVDGMVPLGVVLQRMTAGLDSFPLLAIPLFILAGHLLNSAGIAARIFAFALSLVGHIRGGLAHVNVVASIIFAGMSGVAQADAAGLGMVEIRAMRKAGFDPAFAAAVTAASAIIGPLIPPSVIMVVYGVTAQVSVGDLFIAGVVPGLLTGFLLMVTIYLLARGGRVTAPVLPRSQAPETWSSFLRAIPALVAPVLLVGGILVGAATPTELGAITVLYAIALGFAYRELTWRSLARAMGDTLVTFGILLFIVAAAVPFGWVIAVNNIPTEFANWLTGLTDNPYILLLLINLLLLLVGCVMETAAVLLVGVPALLPLATQLGIDPVHFGLIVVFNLLLGGLTPPFGVLLFIMVEIAEVRFIRVVKALLPFYLPLVFGLFLITFVPEISLGLLHLLRAD